MYFRLSHIFGGSGRRSFSLNLSDQGLELSLQACLRTTSRRPTHRRRHYGI